MGQRGPIGTPPHIRAVRYGEAAPPPRTPPAAPAEGSGKSRFQPPDWLSPEAKKAFRRLVIDIDAAWPGTLARMDVMGLAAAAESYAVIVRSAKAMSESDLVEDDPAHKGRVRKTPAWELFAQASRLFTTWAREYGLTLSSRLRMELDAGAPLGDEDDEDLDAVL